jgi:hypothetical protein
MSNSSAESLARAPPQGYPRLPLVVGASILEVIELIHELITLDQELMTLDVGVPVVEAPVVPAVVVVVVAVVVTVVEVVVAGGVLVLLLHAAPTLPIAITAIAPAVAATRRAMRRDFMASSLVVGPHSV